jgi:hypothetical protein
MSDKKNIERLFQEKFKDFEAIPPSQSWEHIASQLEYKKSKKRIIPFWYKMAGVAVLLLAGYLMTDYYTSQSSKTIQNTLPNVVVNQNEGSETNSNSDSVISKTSKTSNADVNSAVVSSKNSWEDENYKTDKQNDIEQNSIQKNAENLKSIVSNTDSEKEKIPVPNAKQNSNEALLNFKKHASKSKNSIVETKKRDNSSIQNNSKNKINKKPSAHSNSVLVSVEKKSSNDSIDQTLAATEEKKSKNTIVQNKNSNEEDTFVKNKISQHKNPIADSKTVFEKNPSNTIPLNKKIQSNDTVSGRVAVLNPLEIMEKEKENAIKKDNIPAIKSNKWKIKPNIAPIVMRASEGSPIASQFKDNGKDYENSLSIGLGVDYAISKKIAIRAGINKFNLGYNTSDIAYYADIADGNTRKSTSKPVLKNVKLNDQSKNMIIEDKATAAPTQNTNQISNESIQAEIAGQDKNEGYLNQQMGYVEIPVEIAYKLIDNKFGIQVFTGLSTLFLNENKIAVVSSGLTTTIGEANNLNKVHYSTNVGVGFKYSFSNAFEANFEPTLKYQLNTFNANSGNFNPYLIGFYTGLSYTF